MGCLLVENCCFCFNLKAGSYIIALVCMVLDLVLGVAVAYKAISKHQSKVWIGAGIYFFGLLLDFMLFYGIKKGKRKLILAWVWLNGIFLGLDIIFIILCIALGWLTALMCLFAFLMVLLKSYSILVVRSHEVSLQEGQILP